MPNTADMQQTQKKEHKVRNFLRGIFVHNIVAKVVCVLAAAAMWVLAAGLA